MLSFLCKYLPDKFDKWDIHLFAQCFGSHSRVTKLKV